MKSALFIKASFLAASVFVAYAAEDVIPAGTQIAVRTNDRIRMKDATGDVFPGVIANDVADANGRVVIPRGADAELMVRRVANNELGVDLESVTVNGRRYAVASSEDLRKDKDGLGKNGRTGKFVGGGALLGTVIGAIAGGGKGAAIGAISGAGAGAGTQVLTRGKSVDIPAESVLTFRLEQQLVVDVRGRRERER